MTLNLIFAAIEGNLLLIATLIDAVLLAIFLLLLVKR
jgi:hypothetical protein